MDKENVNFDNVLKDIEDKLGKEAVPLQSLLVKKINLKVMLTLSI